MVSASDAENVSRSTSGHNRWARRARAALIVVIVLALSGVCNRFAKEYVTVHTVADAVQKSRVNVIEPNRMTVGEPFAIGLKPEWWYGQWLVVPTTTPTGKTILLRMFVEQTLMTTRIARVQLAFVQHDPELTDEAKAYGLEQTPIGIAVNNIPPELFLGNERVNLRRWCPGSFR
jgi:hypothetical protein